MRYTTYLFGAGASANAIPTVNSQIYRIEDLLSILNRKRDNMRENGQLMKGINFEGFDKFVKEIESIYNKIKVHYSIDTYARKLYLTDSQEYEKLKHFINFYFIFEQLSYSKIIKSLSLPSTRNSINAPEELHQYITKVRENTLDHRYDVFFAALFEKPIKFPDKYKIISYNYDNQIELAFDFYQSFYQSYDTLGIYYGDDQKENNILRLNGFTYLDNENPNIKVDEIDMCSILKSKISSDLNFDYAKYDFINAISNYYGFISGDRKVGTLINYAWDNDKYSNYVKMHSSEIIKYSDNIVIIGYSFPEFNKESDRRIFYHIPEDATVYIQNTADNIDEIVRRFRQRLHPSHHNLKFEIIASADQFFIP